MALEAVVKEIEASVEARIAEIRRAQEAEIRAINNEADAQISEMKNKQDRKTQDACEALARQERSSAELESKKLVLQKKKEVLESAFSDALENLNNAPHQKKLSYYKAMAQQAKSIIPSPYAIMSTNDNFTAKELGVEGVEKSDMISSGLIFRSKDGKIEVDMQFSVLLKGVWDENIKEISEILFG